MMNKKIEYRLRDVFREANSMAHAIRWQYILFLGTLFLLIYIATQVIFSLLGKPSTPKQTYLFVWVIVPIIIQFIAALYISGISYTAAFKKFMMGKVQSHSFFDYFTKVFAVSILVFYISHCLYLVVAYPGISRGMLGGHPVALGGLMLLSFVIYLLASTFFIFSFLHVLFGEHGVRSSLTASYRHVRPHWPKVFVLMLALLLGVTIPYALVRLAFKYLSVSNIQTLQVIHGLGFGVIGVGLLIWLSPILVSAFLISYRKLAMNAN